MELLSLVGMDGFEGRSGRAHAKKEELKKIYLVLEIIFFRTKCKTLKCERNVNEKAGCRTYVLYWPHRIQQSFKEFFHKFKQINSSKN
jgi:hypothetical protein